MHIIFVISEGQLLSTVFCFYTSSSSTLLASVCTATCPIVHFYWNPLQTIVFDNILKEKKKQQKTELNFKIRCVQLVALNIPRGHKTYLKSSAVAQQNEIRIKKLFKILFSRRQKTATVICLWRECNKRW